MLINDTATSKYENIKLYHHLQASVCHWACIKSD